jgi:hypothetical protein
LSAAQGSTVAEWSTFAERSTRTQAAKQSWEAVGVAQVAPVGMICRRRSRYMERLARSQATPFSTRVARQSQEAVAVAQAALVCVRVEVMIHRRHSRYRQRLEHSCAILSMMVDFAETVKRL